MPSSESQPPTVSVYDLELMKRRSLSQLLIRAGRLVDERGVAEMSARGRQVRRSHTALFAYIEHEGTRLSVLAEKLGISKQAVTQRVDELEAMGAVERVPDPADRRAKLVRFGDEGRRAMAEGLSILSEIDEELERALGATRAARMRRGLALVIESLEHEER